MARIPTADNMWKKIRCESVSNTICEKSARRGAISASVRVKENNTEKKIEERLKLRNSDKKQNLKISRKVTITTNFEEIFKCFKYVKSATWIEKIALILLRWFSQKIIERYVWIFLLIDC